MQLTEITITNFRSIDKVSIDLNDRCKVFLGINETGKSNILDAISALSDDFTFDFALDAKQPTKEPYEQELPKIRYTFAFSPDEKMSLLKDAFGENHEEWPFNIGSITPQGFASKLISTHSYEITLNKDNTKTNEDWYILNTSLLKPKKDWYLTTADVVILDNNGVEVTLKKGEIALLFEEQIGNWESVEKSIKKLVDKPIAQKLYRETCDYMANNLPDIIYWKYRDSMLLADPVPIQDFCDNPDISIPLKSIFHLAGIKEIKSKVENDLQKDSLFLNLLENLSKVATNHLRDVWKEYKDINIVLKETAKRISVLIKDEKNLYTFKQRSDGFKRFISFLLILSAQSRTNSIQENTLILMDEPDSSLHPSGIRHLLKEILKISKHNYCLIASHSTFFIDRNNIGRHYIVKKENECTLIKAATYQNFTDEEVLHNALGTSVFNILKMKNIFFEGWTDKEAFNILRNLYKDDIPDITALDEIGICWSSSANKICDVLRPLLWDNERYFLIVSDHDSMGRKEKMKFERELSESSSKYYTYKELSKKRLEELTLEDLLPDQLIFKLLNKHLAENVDTLSKMFTKSQVSGGIIKSWDTFVSKNYKDCKENLKKGYKNILPEIIKEHIKLPDSGKVKEDFKHYKKFLENVVKVFSSM